MRFCDVAKTRLKDRDGGFNKQSSAKSLIIAVT